LEIFTHLNVLSKTTHKLRNKQLARIIVVAGEAHNQNVR